jgi:hypothetical protein
MLNKKFGTNKMIISNPALSPFGIFRRVPMSIKKALGNIGIGEGYTPHYIVKYDGEIEERIRYFSSNFNLLRDLSRVLAVGNQANMLAEDINTDLLYIQSLKDEFVSVNPNLRFYDRINMPEYSSNNINPTKKKIEIPNGEHAIMEEQGIYPDLYKELDDFIRRK